MASMEYVWSAPAKRSEADLRPGIANGEFDGKIGVNLQHLPRFRFRFLNVACAVCPSCQKNSSVRRKSLVRSSQRTTLFH